MDRSSIEHHYINSNELTFVVADKDFFILADSSLLRIADRLKWSEQVINGKISLCFGSFMNSLLIYYKLNVNMPGWLEFVFRFLPNNRYNVKILSKNIICYT